MSKLIIFDADSIIFTVAWKFRDKNVKAMVTMHLNKFISDIITKNQATHYIGFFGSKKEDAKPNFRFNVDPDYKLNRPETPEWVKKWRPLLFEGMENKWNFMGVDGMEADDACAIAAKHFRSEFDEIVIAACDKDLKQIPNVTYYNYQKHIAFDINEFDAAKFLAIQVLMGDSTDGIKGLDGIGPKKAANLLADCTTIPQLKWTVARMYAEQEATLRSKAKTKILAEVKTELVAEHEAKALLDHTLKSLTEPQLDRMARIASKKRLAIAVFDTMPGGWKKYLKVQSELLTLLTESPDWFILPTPVESTIALPAPKKAKEVDVVNPVTPMPMSKPDPGTADNFLYL